MLYSGRFVNLEFTELLLCILLLIKPHLILQATVAKKGEGAQNMFFAINKNNITHNLKSVVLALYRET